MDILELYHCKVSNPYMRRFHIGLVDGGMELNFDGKIRSEEKEKEKALSVHDRNISTLLVSYVKQNRI